MKSLEPPYRAVAKSIFSGIDSIRGTPLDLDNRDTIWENVSSVEVRLKTNTDITKDAIQEIVGGDFDRVWDIFRQSDYYPPAEIMEGCFRGEEVFINAFYKKYGKLICHAIIGRMGGYREYSPEDVQDIFQSFFCKLIENNFAFFRGVHDIYHPTPLIHLVARQYTGKYFRRRWLDNQRRHNLNQRPEQDPGAIEPPEDDMIRIYEEALASLDETQQKVLKFYIFDNLKYKEIADVTGLTGTNVGAIISRAKQEMQDFIRRRYPEFL